MDLLSFCVFIVWEKRTIKQGVLFMLFSISMEILEKGGNCMLYKEESK